MARKIKNKNITNSRLLKDYASWIYCDKCNKTIAYLCYVTYNHFDFNYTCNCNNIGSIYIDFEDTTISKKVKLELVKIKNRLCCPKDNSALLTIQDDNLKSYEIDISCKECNNSYHIYK